MNYTVTLFFSNFYYSFSFSSPLFLSIASARAIFAYAQVHFITYKLYGITVIGTKLIKKTIKLTKNT